MKYLFLVIIIAYHIIPMQAGSSVSYWPPIDNTSDDLIQQLETCHDIPSEMRGQLIEKLYSYAIRQHNAPLLARAYYFKAVNGPSDSLDYFLMKALATVDSVHYFYDHARIVALHGIRQIQDTTYFEAFVNLNAAANCFAAVGDTMNAAKCQANLGLLFMNLEEYQTALSYLQKADSLFNRLHAAPQQLYCRKDIALCLGNNGERKAACNLLENLLNEEFAPINDTLLTIACLFAYCDFTLDFEKEKLYIIKAYEMARLSNNPIIILPATLNMGWMYFKCGSFAKAENMVTQVYKGFDIYKDNASLHIDLKGSTYNLMSQVYKMKGNWEKAYHFLSLYEECQQLNYKINAFKRIQSFKIYKEREQQKYQMKQIKQEVEQKRKETLLTGVILMILLIMSGIIIFLLYKREQVEKRLRAVEQKEYSAKLETEQQKVDAKSRELSLNSMLLIKRNEGLKQLKAQIDSYKKAGMIKRMTEREIQGKINEVLNENKDWEAFKLHFNEINPYFFDLLSKKHPDLSNNDLRLCAYIKMCLNTKQIAQLLAVQPQTITIARYRMKKKMKLGKDDSLDEYIRNIL